MYIIIIIIIIIIVVSVSVIIRRCQYLTGLLIDELGKIWKEAAMA